MSKLQLAALALIAAVFALPAEAREARVRVEQGTLAGDETGGLRNFLGVPFAAPPVGEWRWRAPQTPARWRGVRQATAFAPSCMQGEMPNGFPPWTPEFFPHSGVSEDCLYLNVWTPASARRGGRLPVFVYVPGGGFRNGGGAVPVNNGAELARRGLVVVTLNYRVGAFGFLAQGEGRDANYGVADVIAALRWVQANAAAFGGDPERVTLAGQSAGGAVVNALLASPHARGLFQRAIVQSSPLGAIPVGNRAAAEAQAAQFLTEIGASSIEAARAIPAAAILAASDRTNFRPFIDGQLIAEDPARVMAEGRGNDVPTMTGIVEHETRARPDLATLRTEAQQRFGEDATTALALYPASTDAEAVEAGLAIDRDRGLAGLERWAAARARHHRSAFYVYLWTHAEPGPDAALYRAFHSSELVYEFGTFAHAAGRTFTERDHSIFETLQTYWLNFAAAGDPNGAGLAAWPAAQGTPAPVMELGDRWAPITPLADDKRALAERFFTRAGMFAF